MNRPSGRVRATALRGSSPSGPTKKIEAAARRPFNFRLSPRVMALTYFTIAYE